MTVPHSYGGVIDALVRGEWIVPATGEPASIPIENIVIAESLDGAEADLIAPLHAGKRILVVSDRFTHGALGERIYKALAPRGNVGEFVWQNPRCTDEGVAELIDATAQADAMIAVGSGTINDSVKYATFQTGREYSVFPTSPMNAYSTSTASVSVGGMKRSISCHSAKGLFCDLGILAKCPPRLIRAAFADVVCRTTAQVDWLMSHLLFGTPYTDTPYVLLAYDEDSMLDHAEEIASGKLEPLAVLTRIATVMGLGTSFTGTTHVGSMAEHMISHYIDMFAGDAHPGTSHGEQVGVATVAMSALQNSILGADTPPEIRPTEIPQGELTDRYGGAMADLMHEQTTHKALDGAATDRLNERFATGWSDFIAPLREVMVPLARLDAAMARAGSQRTAAELGLDAEFYRDGLRHARFSRDRFTILDLAGDSGLLDDFAAGRG